MWLANMRVKVGDGCVFFIQSESCVNSSTFVNGTLCSILKNYSGIADKNSKMRFTVYYPCPSDVQFTPRSTDTLRGLKNIIWKIVLGFLKHSVYKVYKLFTLYLTMLVTNKWIKDWVEKNTFKVYGTFLFISYSDSSCLQLSFFKYFIYYS